MSSLAGERSVKLWKAAWDGVSILRWKIPKAENTLEIQNKNYYDKTLKLKTMPISTAVLFININLHAVISFESNALCKRYPYEKSRSNTICCSHFVNTFCFFVSGMIWTTCFFCVRYFQYNSHYANSKSFHLR